MEHVCRCGTKMVKITHRRYRFDRATEEFSVAIVCPNCQPEEITRAVYTMLLAEPAEKVPMSLVIAGWVLGWVVAASVLTGIVLTCWRVFHG